MSYPNDPQGSMMANYNGPMATNVNELRAQPSSMGPVGKPGLLTSQGMLEGQHGMIGPGGMGMGQIPPIVDMADRMNYNLQQEATYDPES